MDRYMKGMRSCMSCVSKVCKGVEITKGEEVRRSLERTPWAKVCSEKLPSSLGRTVEKAHCFWGKKKWYGDRWRWKKVSGEEIKDHLLCHVKALGFSSFGVKWFVTLWDHEPVWESEEKYEPSLQKNVYLYRH